MSKHKRDEYLKDEEIERMLDEELSGGDDSFSSESDGSSDDYFPSESEYDDSSDDDISYRSGQFTDLADEDDPAAVSPKSSSTTNNLPANNIPGTSKTISVNNLNTIPANNLANGNGVPSTSNTTPANNSANSVLNSSNTIPQAVLWDINDMNFVPRFDIGPKVPRKVSCSKLNKDSTELQVFSQVFPKSLLKYMAECTNIRLELLRSNTTPTQRVKKRKTPPKYTSYHTNTDHYEIEIIIGVLLVMSYNRVPELQLY